MPITDAVENLLDLRRTCNLAVSSCEDIPDDSAHWMLGANPIRSSPWRLMHGASDSEYPAQFHKAMERLLELYLRFIKIFNIGESLVYLRHYLRRSRTVTAELVGYKVQLHLIKSPPCSRAWR